MTISSKNLEFQHIQIAFFFSAPRIFKDTDTQLTTLLKEKLDIIYARDRYQYSPSASSLEGVAYMILNKKISTNINLRINFASNRIDLFSEISGIHEPKLTLNSLTQSVKLNEICFNLFEILLELGAEITRFGLVIRAQDFQNKNNTYIEDYEKKFINTRFIGKEKENITYSLVKIETIKKDDFLENYVKTEAILSEGKKLNNPDSDGLLFDFSEDFNYFYKTGLNLSKENIELFYNNSLDYFDKSIKQID